LGAVPRRMELDLPGIVAAARRAGLVVAVRAGVLLRVHVPVVSRRAPALSLRPDHAARLESVHPDRDRLDLRCRPARVFRYRRSRQGRRRGGDAMNRVARYVKSLMLLELFKGLALTGKYLVRKKYTMRYPMEKIPQ